MYSVNDGFNLGYHYNVNSMLDSLEYNWSYNERNAPYRMSDFMEYDKQTKEWFKFEFANETSGAVGQIIRINLNSNVIDLLEFTKFAVFDGVRSYADFGFIFSRDFSNNAPIYFYKLASVVDFDFNDNYNFKIPDVCTVGNSYQIRPVITTASTNMEMRETRNTNELTGFWFSFPPNCYGQFTVVESGGGGTQVDLLRYIDININNLNFVYDDGYLTLSNITGNVNSVISETFSGDLYVNFELRYDYQLENGNTTYVVIGSDSFVLNEDNYLWNTTNFVYNNTIQLVNELKDPDILQFKMVINLSLGTNQQTEILNFQVSKS